jgi:hypothetical protein
MVATVAVLVAGCLGHHSSSDVPTVDVHPAKDGIILPSQIAIEMAQKCPSARGEVGFDVREGTAHLHAHVTCALTRADRSGLEQELVELAGRRNDATQRADFVNTLAKELGVRPYPRADMVWDIGMGLDECSRVDDVASHRENLAIAAAGSERETPVHWTEVEAVRYAGTCRKRLGDFFDSVAKAGQPAAASTVRHELARLGVSS